MKAYLDDLGLPYWTEGKNVTDGWVNITCVFCPDHSNHLGIHYEAGNYFNCWLCGMDGDIIDLIRKLEGVSFHVAKLRLEQYQGLILPKQEIVPKSGNKEVLPEDFEWIREGKEPDLVRRLMKDRGFPLSHLQKHRCGWVEQGWMQYRMIVPIFMSGQVVSFQGIDTTGQADVKYKGCPKSRTLIPPNHIVYGLDNVDSQIVLVEGVFDKWRMGDDAVALLTKGWAKPQILNVRRKAKELRINRVKVLLDIDAMKNADELSFLLSELFDDVLFIQLDPIQDAKDPDKLPPEKIAEILKI